MKRPTKEPYKSYGKYRLKLEEYCDHLESELEKVRDENKAEEATFKLYYDRVVYQMGELQRAIDHLPQTKN